MVAWGYLSPKSIVAAWLKSPEHKEVLDSFKFKHCAVSNYNKCSIAIFYTPKS